MHIDLTGAAAVVQPTNEEEEDDDEDVVITPAMLAQLAHAGVFGGGVPHLMPQRAPRRTRSGARMTTSRQQRMSARRSEQVVPVVWMTAHGPQQGAPPYWPAPPPSLVPEGYRQQQPPPSQPPQYAPHAHPPPAQQQPEAPSSQEYYYAPRDEPPQDPQPWLSDPHLVALDEMARLAATQAESYRACWEGMRAPATAHTWTDDERTYIGKKCNEYVDMAARFQETYAQEVTKFKDIFLVERGLLQFANEHAAFYDPRRHLQCADRGGRRSAARV